MRVLQSSGPSLNDSEQYIMHSDVKANTKKGSLS